MYEGIHAEKDLAKLTQKRNELLASGKTSEKGTKSLLETINKRIQTLEEANANKQQLQKLDDDLVNLIILYDFFSYFLSFF